MFTGIIEDLGQVERVSLFGQGAVIAICTALPAAKIKIGESIAVNGTCLTVTAKGRGKFSADISAETLCRTTLGELRSGDRVNLERCLTLGKLLGGHLVSGHVDGIGRIVSIRAEGNSKLFTFAVAPAAARYLIEKGSIAIDGISLTAFAVRGRNFTAALIPHTLKATTLGRKRAGDAVNVESDLMAKYVEKILAVRESGRGEAAARKHIGLPRRVRA
ncbi:MAG: riboflavin synthase [Candidatus Binataceae bacterium]